MSQASSSMNTQTSSTQGENMSITKEITVKVTLEAGTDEERLLQELKRDINIAMALGFDGVGSAEIVEVK
jgi:hypothetical protein